MSQKLTDTAIVSSRTVSGNFQCSFTTDNEDRQHDFMQEFHELVFKWSDKVQINSFTITTNDHRKFDEIFDYDEETQK